MELDFPHYHDKCQEPKLEIIKLFIMMYLIREASAISISIRCDYDYDLPIVIYHNISIFIKIIKNLLLLQKELTIEGSSVSP